MEILNETYYGKSKKLIECESLIAKIKDSLEKDPKQNVNKLPEMKKLRENLQKEFGFEEIKLVVNPNYVAVNALTLKFLYNKKVMYQKDLKMICSKNGIRYKDPKNKKIYIEIYAGLITKSTPEQIIATLLHEIGHNFYITEVSGRFVKLDQIMEKYIQFCKEFRKNIGTIPLKNIIQIVNTLMKFRNVMNKVKKIIYDEDRAIIENTTEIHDFEEYINYLEAYINYCYDRIVKASKEYEKENEKNNGEWGAFLKIIMSIFRTLALPFRLVSFYLLPFSVDGIRNNDDLIDARIDEKFADNFAASYGYGKAFVETEKNVFMPLTSDYYGGKLKFLLKFTFFANYKNQLKYDEHHTDLSRMRFIKNKLEYELEANKDKLTPKQIEEIKQQIEEIIDLIDNNKSEYQQYQEEFERRFGNPVDRIEDGKVSDSDIFDFDTKMQTEYKIQSDGKTPTARDIK